MKPSTKQLWEMPSRTAQVLGVQGLGFWELGFRAFREQNHDP